MSYLYGLKGKIISPRTRAVIFIPGYPTLSMASSSCAAAHAWQVAGDGILGFVVRNGIVAFVTLCPSRELQALRRCAIMHPPLTRVFRIAQLWYYNSFRFFVAT